MPASLLARLEAAKVAGAPVVAAHPHLSIGEVLSLLQEEFPDVTISKIRFLESQGLVDPERTPSGYRKFYDADIERLRWVLRQQRDAFLPLKVIKGRLEGQDSFPLGEETDETFPGAEPPAGPDGGRGRDGAEASRAGRGRSAEPVALHRLGAGEAVRAASAGREEARSPRGTSPAVARRPADGGSDEPANAAQLFDVGPPYSAYGMPGRGGITNRRAAAGAARTRSEANAAPATRPGAAAAGAADRAAGPATRAEPASKPARAAAGGGDDDKRQGRPAPEGRPASTGGRGGRPLDVGAVPADDELALDELVNTAGVDLETVRDLERYGLITPRVVAGASYYTQEAAVIAHLASAFARHGVEARHLRAYKGAAEREAGMVQQVIMPLIRQRNPEARLAAAHAAEELSQLGGELRAALLRSALSDLS